MKPDVCAVCRSTNLKLVVKLQCPLYKCQNCGLVQVSHVPAKSAVAALYKGNYWKNYQPYGSQETAHRQYFEQKVQMIKKLRKNGRLLDIGCALGTFMEEAEKKGFQTAGIDISSY